MSESASCSCIVADMVPAADMTEIVLSGAGGPERLLVRRAAVPTPGPGQLLIRTEAAGVGFNDVTTRQGRNPGALPRVLGFDVVGRVQAMGSGTVGFRTGDRVAVLLGTGGYSTHVVADAAAAVLIDGDGLDPTQVDALVLNYVTAWQMLHRVAQVQPGQAILVLGAAGGVGSALVELARLDGITVYGTAGAGRRSVVESGGAHWVPDAAAVPVRVHATFDPVGGGSLRTSRRSTRRNGVVVSFGFGFTVAAGHSKWSGLVRTAGALVRARLTPGATVRIYAIERSVRRNGAQYRDDLLTLVGLLAAGRIHPAVTTVPLTAAADAHRRLEARQIVGKIVLVPSPPTAADGDTAVTGP